MARTHLHADLLPLCPVFVNLGATSPFGGPLTQQLTLIIAANRFHAGRLLTWRAHFGRAIFSLRYAALHNARPLQASRHRPRVVLTACLPRLFPEVFQNGAPVNANAAVNTSATPRLPDGLQKGAISDSRGGAPSIFPGPETVTVLSACIVCAPHPSEGLPLARRQPARGTSPFHFSVGEQRRRGNLPPIASHFPPSAFKLGRGKMEVVRWSTHAEVEAIFHCYYDRTQRAER